MDWDLLDHRVRRLPGTLKGEKAEPVAEPQDPVACVWPGTYLDAGTVVRHAGGQRDEN